MSKKIKATIEDEVLTSIFENTAVSILDYCNKIIKSNVRTDDIFTYSELCLKVSKLNSYEEILNCFAEYYLLLYPHLSFLVKTERFEMAEVISKAIRKETDFVLCFVLQNFTGLTKDVNFIEKKFRDYYLN